MTTNNNQEQGRTAPTARSSRNTLIVALFQQGKTLQEIGDHFGLTRERVRQIVNALDSAPAILAKRRQDRDAARAAQQLALRHGYTLRAWGLTLDEYNAHVAEHGNSGTQGSPMHRFTEQRKNALRRGVAWEFSFKEWWAVWQKSGRWDTRGRGDGYCMARHGDTGPYSKTNVYICPSKQNVRDQYQWREHHWSKGPQAATEPALLSA